MLKIISLLKRKPEMSFDDFEVWAQKSHPRLALALPGLRAYRMNTVVSGSADSPYDAASEMWFDDDADRVAAFASDAGKAAAADAIGHCSSRTHLLMNEHVILSD
jgi:uncharacterized protein (TIGR02118 family)